VLLSAFLCYSIYIYATLPASKETVSKESANGKLLWQKYNCNACHQVYGLGGFLGPDLTNSWTLKGPAFINAFLKNGTGIMPNFHLSDNEITAFLAYLKNIDASGKADPRTFTINSNGTIEQ